jgi:hypothetical protein
MFDRSRWERLRGVLGTVAYPTATVLSLRHPRLAVAIYFLLAAFYLLPGRSLPITQESTIWKQNRAPSADKVEPASTTKLCI